MYLNALTEEPTVAGVSPAILLLAALIVFLYLLLIVITRGRALTIFARLFRSARFIRSTQRVGARARNYVGTSGFAPLSRMFHPLTETEMALVEADAMTPCTEKALDVAIEEYRKQGSRNPDIDSVVHLFADKEQEFWEVHRSEALSEQRQEFFRKYREAIRKQPDAIKPREGEDSAPSSIEFEDVDFSKIDYEKIGVYIDETQILSENAFRIQNEKMEREGMIFKDLSIESGFIRLSEEFDIKQAERNYLLASKFFLHDIPVQSDEDLLYEDINDSLTVRMMGSADKDIFYYLTEMRKTVNRNVRLLATLIAIFVAAFIFANYWFASAMDVMHPLPALASGSESNFLEELTSRITSQPFKENLVNRSIFAAVTFLIVLSFVGFYYRNPYTHYQSQNRVHLINFMTGYSALLVSNYTHAESQSRGSFSGDQTGTAARENSKIWFMNMQWIAFRLFCVEVFLRSVIFQIKRNSGYYILGMPLLIIVPTILFLCWLPDWVGKTMGFIPPGPVNGGAPAGGFDFEMATIGVISWVLLNAAFGLLLLLLVWNVCWKGCLTKCVQGFLNIRDTSWKNFHNLDLQRVSGSLVRHFVAEIYNERNRWRSGAGGGGNG